MRNIVVCMDGTWNTPDQMDRGRQVASNVVKMARAVKTSDLPDDLEQLVFYDTGVGTGNRWDKFVGGMTGRGIMNNIMDAYEWLFDTYHEGDHLYLFGFSRGAYTARSICGILSTCGLPPRTMDNLKNRSMIFLEAKRIYRIKDPDRRREEATVFKERFGVEEKSCNVYFIGVWDTVGALGVPTAGLLGWWTRRRSGFHDVKLGPGVKYAYHALAINERRGPFKPTLWETSKHINPGQAVEQVWFPGVHSNIGGGYADTGLSDRALVWMINKAAHAGLKVDNTFIEKRTDPNWFGELRDSMSAMYKVLLHNLPKDRPIGLSDPATEYLHISAGGRWTHPSSPEQAPENYKDAVNRGVGENAAPVWERDFHESIIPLDNLDEGTGG